MGLKPSIVSRFQAKHIPDPRQIGPEGRHRGDTAYLAIALNGQEAYSPGLQSAYFKEKSGIKGGFADVLAGRSESEL